MKIKLWQKVMAGMVLGIISGYILKEQALILKPIGTLFINLIKMVVIPLIFFSILNGVTNMNDASTFGRVGSKAFFAYCFTTIFAVMIGLGFAIIFKPGVGLNIQLSADSVTHVQKSALEILMDIIPTNPIQAMAASNTMQVVVFAFFTGFALILIGDKGREVKNLVVSASHLVFKMIELVIKLTPYGVFAIMSWVVGVYGLDVMFSLGKFVLVVMGALSVQYVLFGVMLFLFAGLNPLPFYKKMINTQMLAFATVSSKATLATAIKELQNKVGVSKQSASFLLPLGASINMDATAIYLGICSVFFAQVVGMELGMTQYLMIILTCTLGSIGAAGFPGGAMVMMGMVLTSVGLPLEGMSIILGVDRFLEMLRTTVNITGDCTITVLIDKSEGTFNKKIYYSEEKDDEQDDD